MRKLILIKHAAPKITPGVSSEKWPLSEAGRHQCSELAASLLPLEIQAIVSSLEPKAAETGEILSERLGVPFEAAKGLHEHDRSNVPHLPTREFISLVELFFREPGRRVLGRESADEALSRFHSALDAMLEAYPDGNVGVVSHGTVIALLLSEIGGGKGFELWRKMGLPSYAVIELPSWDVVEVLERV